MSFTINSASEAVPYQRQIASFRRTRSAILEGAKSVIVRQGVAKTSMIEIADEAEVSRATLYNHFRDKRSVLRALLEYEVERILDGAGKAGDTATALRYIAGQVSSDPALAMIRRSDPALLTSILSAPEDLLRLQVEAFLVQLNVAAHDLALRWLIGQCLAPLGEPEIALHARFLSDLV